MRMCWLITMLTQVKDIVITAISLITTLTMRIMLIIQVRCQSARYPITIQSLTAQEICPIQHGQVQRWSTAPIVEWVSTHISTLDFTASICFSIRFPIHDLLHFQHPDAIFSGNLHGLLISIFSPTKSNKADWNGSIQLSEFNVLHSIV